MMMKVGSLFSGIGGFELGFESTNQFKTIWQVEIEEFQRTVLKKNFPGATRHSDVRNVDSSNLEWVDVILAGFPCQDISIAGKKDGIDGRKSKLFYECIRIFDEMRPRFVVLENVSALRDRGLDVVLGELSEIGFNARWHTLQSADFGTQHRRDRVFIIGVNKCFAERTIEGWYCLRCGTGIHGGCECNHFEWQCTECGEWTYPFHEEVKDGCSFCGCRVVTYSSRLGTPAGLAEAGFKKRYPTKSDNNINDKSRQEGQAGLGQGSTGTGVCGSFHGIPNLMDRRWLKINPFTHSKKNRVKRISALGNSIVPQVAKAIAEIVIELDSNYDF